MIDERPDAGRRDRGGALDLDGDTRAIDGTQPDPGPQLVRRFQYKCRPCEYASPIYEEREDANDHAAWHRYTFEHWFAMIHVEGIESIAVEVAVADVGG